MKIVRVAIVLSLLALLTTGGYFVYSFRDVLGILPPLRLKKTGYLRVIQAIQNGQLGSKSSIIALPSSYKEIAPRDQVLYERRKDGRLWVLFPTWYGRGADLQGYLYSSGPLKAQDFYTIDWGSDGVAQHVDACGADMLDVKKIDANWYSVMRRLD